LDITYEGKAKDFRGGTMSKHKKIERKKELDRRRRRRKKNLKLRAKALQQIAKPAAKKTK
jgi:hypothetical protein